MSIHHTMHDVHTSCSPWDPVLIDDAEGLSPREHDVLERIASGMSNDEIARSLYLSVNSVKTYIRSIYRKIGVERRSQAVLWAIRHGVLDLDTLDALDIPGTSSALDRSSVTGF